MPGPDVIGVLIGFGVVVVVPIVAMLLHHQRKMATLIHGGPEAGGAQERIQRMEEEVTALRNSLTELTLRLDDQERDLRLRLGQGDN